MPKHKKSTKRWKPTKKRLQDIERTALILRKRGGVEGIDPLDPIELANRYATIVRYLDETLLDLPSEIRQHLLSMDAKVWSGMANVLPDGTLLVILNPNQTPERARVTVMEEVAHIHYGHNPSQLGNMGSREYDEAAEQEAYQTAAATLLPAKAVGQAVWLGQSAETLARRFGVSVELTEMRIKIWRLWKHYQIESTKDKDD